MRISILSILCMLSITVMAQQKEYSGTIGVSPLQFEQVGDSLLVQIRFDLSDVNVDSRRSISLIPVIVASNGVKKLPEVMLKGRANYLNSRRELALMNDAELAQYYQNEPYALVKGYKAKESKQILYKKSILFEPWMSGARIDIREDLCGCGNAPRTLASSTLVGRVLLEKVIEPYVITPFLAYTQPVPEAIKRREMVGEAFLDFVLCKINIRPDYMGNPRELKKITDMVTEVKNNPDITVSGISVEGYASPEGIYEFNKYLSQGRANALVDYLIPRFDYPREMYSVTYGGENWGELLDMVKLLNMKDKEPVLEILTDKSIDNEVRKSRLRKLLGGEPYRYIVKEYCPLLRKAICKIDYKVKNFDVVQAKTEFKKHPQNLSLNEMYLVAQTFDVGSAEFIELFETAIRFFPNDETANLNAACAALSRGDILSAERLLSRVTNLHTPAADNARGVLLMLKGDYQGARNFLASAFYAGLVDASMNIEQMNKKMENEKALSRVKNK